ncbi:formimidoylglutamase [Maribacter algicola]|uniref:Formimidoylglutamase n=1 Tax=Meishania litoralis TaxID=3434685 RepID=A0ACC7LH28_9FLAO
MGNFVKPDKKLWTGRISDRQLYLHEKVEFVDLNESNLEHPQKTFAIIGYACDEGVKRNHGRTGAFEGPDAIRKQLGKMPNHLDTGTRFLDIGTIQCSDGNMEATQDLVTEKVHQLLNSSAFPILLGGGHDIAYGHYNGIRKHLGSGKSLGIINFDAHFDLRNNSKGNNSGTPFFQIAEDCKEDGSAFKYLCLGVRKDANDAELFVTAEALDVTYMPSEKFSMSYPKIVVRELLDFIAQVDHIYVTIDLDGFSSAYAPGVSAPSPMGFCTQIVLESLELIIKSQKMVSFDIAEMNPKYDIDDQTAKLAASLVHFTITSLNGQ